MNVIGRLEFELAYYDPAVQRFNHYTTKTSLCVLCTCVYICVCCVCIGVVYLCMCVEFIWRYMLSMRVCWIIFDYVCILCIVNVCVVFVWATFVPLCVHVVSVSCVRVYMYMCFYCVCVYIYMCVHCVCMCWVCKWYIYMHTGTLAQRLECSPMAWETWVQSQVESYQRL